MWKNLVPRVFEDVFNWLLSEAKILEYLKDVEDVVFDNTTESGIDFLSLENQLYQFDKKLILDLMPSKYFLFCFYRSISVP